MASQQDIQNNNLPLKQADLWIQNKMNKKSSPTWTKVKTYDLWEIYCNMISKSKRCIITTAVKTKLCNETWKQSRRGRGWGGGSKRLPQQVLFASLKGNGARQWRGPEDSGCRIHFLVDFLPVVPFLPLTILGLFLIVPSFLLWKP